MALLPQPLGIIGIREATVGADLLSRLFSRPTESPQSGISFTSGADLHPQPSESWGIQAVPVFTTFKSANGPWAVSMNANSSFFSLTTSWGLISCVWRFGSYFIWYAWFDNFQKNKNVYSWRICLGANNELLLFIVIVYQ